MKTIRYISGIIIILVISTHSIIAQDHHFSQYDATYQYLNPALTGMSWKGKYDWRANSSYRTQWGSIASKPFTNQLIAYDMPYKEFGVGALIYNNRAGSGNLNTLNFMLSGAYEITIDPSNIHNLYGGLQLGLFHRNIKVSNLIFDSQYSYAEGGYSSDIESGENIADKSILRFDANMGFFYKYYDKNKQVSPHAGLSIFHGTKPNESFTSLKSRIPIRWAFYGGCDYRLNDQLTLNPGILYMFEAKAYDLVIGSMMHYILNDPKYVVISGLSYRHKDAIIIHAGMEYERVIFRMSYDLNISYLKSYTNMNGGLEFSLAYTFMKNNSVSRVSF